MYRSSKPNRILVYCRVSQSLTAKFYLQFNRWACRDRRYLIKLDKTWYKKYGVTYPGICQWDESYDDTPANLTCKLHYCDNATAPPEGNNFNFTKTSHLKELNGYFWYSCKSGLYIEADTEYKTKKHLKVTCAPSGEWEYPSPWPQCSQTVTCADPGNSPGVTRSQHSGQEHGYLAQLKYICSDPRKWIKETGSSSLAAQIYNKCHWRRSYPVNGSQLECHMHHCGHPYDHPGAHDPPPEDNHIALVTPSGWDLTKWQIKFGSSVTYKCEGSRYIENSEVDPTLTEYEVECNTTGTYKIPTLASQSWPNCTETVKCCQPPGKPTNGSINGVFGYDGSREWVTPAVDQQDTFNTSVLYKCAKGSEFKETKSHSPSLTNRCQWNKAWKYPELPPCEVTHCTHPSEHNLPPQKNNIDLVADGRDNDTWKVNIDDTITYKCDGSRYFENDEVDPTVTELKVKCLNTGEYESPAVLDVPWPNCTETTQCGKPPAKPSNGSVNGNFGFDGAISWLWGSADLADSYNTSVEYKCAPGSQFEISSEHSRTIRNRCQWNKEWSPHPSLPPCVVTHCVHPADHNPPPEDNHIALVVPQDWTNDTWEVSFGDTITYKCDEPRYFENDEVDPTMTELEVKCLTTGEYESPPVLSAPWPNCTETVKCGQPPAKPVNGIINGVSGFDGSIQWLYSAPELQDTYNTTVKYFCANGSKFDTNSSTAGEALSLGTRCQWDKQWAPYSSLPPCKVTHCIEPFNIPEDSFLEQVTPAWTKVEAKKEYRCQGMKGDGTHTRFFEKDRTKSSFDMKCQSDGTYLFKDERKSWPTCLEGKFV